MPGFSEKMVRPLIYGVIVAVTVIILIVAGRNPLNISFLPDYWLQLLILIAVGVALLLRWYDYSRRYYRKFGYALTALVSFNALPALRLDVFLQLDRNNFLGKLFVDGPKSSFNIILGIICVLLLILDYIENRRITSVSPDTPTASADTPAASADTPAASPDTAPGSPDIEALDSPDAAPGYPDTALGNSNDNQLDDHRSRSRKHLRRRPASYLYAGLSVLIVVVLLTTTSSIASRKETQLLGEAQQRMVLTFEEADTADYQQLLHYFKSEPSNKPLFDHIGSLVTRFSTNEKHQGVTAVAGEAGVGKSFVHEALSFSEDLKTCRIPLRDVLNHPKIQEQLGDTLVQEPDLKLLDGTVINRLPGLSSTFDTAMFSSFVRWTNEITRGNPDDIECDGAIEDYHLFMLDDLDEIDSKTANSVLKYFDTSDFPGDSLFKHVILFGRPEAFDDYFSGDPPNIPLLNLYGPTYKTTADLRFLVNSSVRFNVITRGATDEEQKRFVTVVTERPYLSYSIRNLRFANFVVEKAQFPNPESGRPLCVLLFDDLVNRNTRSHNRPSRDSSSAELYDAYMQLLSRAALDYAVKIDDDGFFWVTSDDKTMLDDDTAVLTRDLLNRSGLALLEPANQSQNRYRFMPFWVHRHLIERYRRGEDGIEDCSHLF